MIQEQVPRNTDKEVSSVEWSRVHCQASSNLEAIFEYLAQQRNHF
jgi:hypothetical protein